MDVYYQSLVNITSRKPILRSVRCKTIFGKCQPFFILNISLIWNSSVNPRKLSVVLTLHANFSLKLIYLLNRQYWNVKRGWFHAIHVKWKHAHMDRTEAMKCYFTNVLELQIFARWVSRTTVQRAALKNAVRDIRKTNKQTNKETRIKQNKPIDQPSKRQTLLVLRGRDRFGQQQAWRADLSSMRTVLIWYSQPNQIWREDQGSTTPLTKYIAGSVWRE